MSIDLDAIQARADAAIDGPWYTVEPDHFGMVSIRQPEPDGQRFRNSYVEVAECGQLNEDDTDSPTAEFIAASRTDIPALIARIRELEPRVFHGDDWETVRDALDALPLGSVIAWVEENGKSVALKENSVMGTDLWYEAGVIRPQPSEKLARHGVPLTVIA